MPDNPLNVLVIGAGMFTCGTGTSGFGTILPALFEAHKSGLVRSVTIAGRDPQKASLVAEKVMHLNSLMGTQIEVNYVPQNGQKDDNTFRHILSSEDFSCAIVAIPDHLHFEVTQCLLEHKVHCLVVKPLVPRLEELDALINSRRSSIYFAQLSFISVMTKPI
jgi:predicted dehydrogenase